MLRPGGVASLWRVLAVGAPPPPAPGLGGQGGAGDLDTRSYWGARLLVSFSTSVTLQPCHPILARTLAVSLVTDLTTRPHGVAVTGPARLLVCHGVLGVAVVAFLAVVTVSSCSVVSALVADTSRHPPRQAVQLHVKPASSGMEVAVARNALVC